MIKILCLLISNLEEDTEHTQIPFKITDTVLQTIHSCKLIQVKSLRFIESGHPGTRRIYIIKRTL